MHTSNYPLSTMTGLLSLTLVSFQVPLNLHLDVLDSNILLYSVSMVSQKFNVLLLSLINYFTVFNILPMLPWDLSLFSFWGRISDRIEFLHWISDDGVFPMPLLLIISPWGSSTMAFQALLHYTYLLREGALYIATRMPNSAQNLILYSEPSGRYPHTRNNS